MERAGTFNEQIAELLLSGSLTRMSDGGFTLTLTGSPGGAPPEPEPEPPVDAIVLYPTGGDDAGKIQTALNNLPSGRALMLSGMFSVGATLWLDGYEKRLVGDPAKQSGLRPSGASYSGHYGAMFCGSPGARRCQIAGLEFDMGGKVVEPVFFDGGEDNEISDCYLHDVGSNPSGPPFGAIHSQNVLGLKVLRNRIERTGGTAGKEGVRGIYVPGKSMWVEGNTVRDTGHTGIAAEGFLVTVVKNVVERANVQGTGYKLVYRPATRRGGYSEGADVRAGEPALYFGENTVRTTVGGGLMLQDCGDAAVLIEKSLFSECGRTGTTFGALYSSNAANNVTFRGNRVENCRSLGGLRYARNWTLTDTTFSGGSQTLYLEAECHYITLTRSGGVQIGQNCDHIVVDGKQVA